MMKFVFSTGGREKYFRAENVGDCVCRAICNATGLDYMTVYNMIQELSRDEKRSKKSSARNGVCKDTVDKLLKKLGWNPRRTKPSWVWITFIRPSNRNKNHPV